MANFDTSNNQQAKIRYLDDGEKLVVEWKDVYLQVGDKDTGTSNSCTAFTKFRNERLKVHLHSK